jgi:hypothetical protein
MPLYNLLNSLEQAHRQGTPTIVTFWDIRRAFDSIPRNLQRLAWQRLGVPTDLAEWFVSLDDQGTAFVTTPYYVANKHIKSSEAIYLNSDHFQDSTATRSQLPHAQGLSRNGVSVKERVRAPSCGSLFTTFC